MEEFFGGVSDGLAMSAVGSWEELKP